MQSFKNQWKEVFQSLVFKRLNFILITVRFPNTLISYLQNKKSCSVILQESKYVKTMDS